MKKDEMRTLNNLSDEQILTYFVEGNGGARNKLSAMIIKNGAFGMRPDFEKGMAMLRQAYEQNKILEVNFIDGEGVDGIDKTIPTSHFTIELRNK